MSGSLCDQMRYTHNTASTVPQVGPVTEYLTRCEIDTIDVNTVAAFVSIIYICSNAERYLRYFPCMTSNNIRVALVIPMRADIVALKVKVYSVSPLAFIPQVCRREDDLETLVSRTTSRDVNVRYPTSKSRCQPSCHAPS